MEENIEPKALKPNLRYTQHVQARMLAPTPNNIRTQLNESSSRAVSASIRPNSQLHKKILAKQVQPRALCAAQIEGTVAYGQQSSANGGCLKFENANDVVITDAKSNLIITAYTTKSKKDRRSKKLVGLAIEKHAVIGEEGTESTDSSLWKKAERLARREVDKEESIARAKRRDKKSGLRR